MCRDLRPPNTNTIAVAIFSYRYACSAEKVCGGEVNYCDSEASTYDAIRRCQHYTLEYYDA